MYNKKEIFLMYILISLLLPAILDIVIPFVKVLNISRATLDYTRMIFTPTFYCIDLSINIVYSSLLFFLILFIQKNSNTKHASRSVGFGLIVHFGLIVLIYKVFRNYFVLELMTVSLILSSSIVIYFLILFKQKIKPIFLNKKKNEWLLVSRRWILRIRSR